MVKVSRRNFLKTGTVTVGSTLVHSPVLRAINSNTSKTNKINMIHVTDLFRPFGDPDDHWDLACVYALAHSGYIDLKGIVIDYPPEFNPLRNPDIAAIAQLNHLTGLNVPVGVGSSKAFTTRKEIQSDAPKSDLQGINLIINTLKESKTPVVINITGSSLDVAVAGNREPELFKEKCAGIYLNAGSGTRDTRLAKTLNYNVSINPQSYAAIFDIECPIYWMPCFEDYEGERIVKEYGTYYKFQHKDILPYLSKGMKNYFNFMYDKYPGLNWLDYLNNDVDHQLIEKLNPQYRNMWCTGGFLYAVGKIVAKSGEIISVREAKDSLVYTFDPVTVSCNDNGITEWKNDANSHDRFIFHVQDINSYQLAMNKALKSLLQKMP